MKKEKKAIIGNPFIHENNTSTSQRLIFQIFDDMYFNTDNELSHLKKFTYVFASLGHGDWGQEPDVLSYVQKKQLSKIRKKCCFFIFDASLEGWSPTGHYSIFDYLYRSCSTHKIDPSMIIYLSGNLEDESNIKKISKKHNCTPFHVVSYPAFEGIVSDDKEATDTNSIRHSAEKLLDIAEKECHRKFNNKLFSSLSRVNRTHRILGTFLLSQSPIAKQGLISHNALEPGAVDTIYHWAKHANVDEKLVTAWKNSLPLTVDYKNFEENWALHMAYGHIHHRTIFQIVNETHADNVNNTSMFFSEKTFRPIVMCQPFVIYGQPGCNHKLQDLGYRLYNKWFDLSFDFEEDNVLRYQKMLKSVEKVCKHLSSLSREEKIAWRFKDKELLLHNCQVMQNSAYTKNKLYQFFKNLHP